MRPLGILVATALTVIAACGDGGGSSQGPPRHGGSVTVGLVEGLSSLDPLALGEGQAPGLATAIYDPLISRSGDRGDLAPWLADSWTHSADLRTWTLRLHAGVRFQDGTPFDAGAAAFNVQRHADPANRSASLSDALLIQGVSAVDDLTMAVTLRSPWVDFPEVLAGPIGLMASPTAVRQMGADYGRRPVGTGPFVLGEWVAGDHLTVTRSPRYWRSGRPYLDRVTWRAVPGQDAGYAALAAGRIDVLQGATADQVDAARRDRRLEVWQRPADGATVLAMNTRTPPFDSVDARLAVSYATNRAAIASQVAHGLYPVAAGVFPPGSSWRGGVAEPGYDAARARAAVRAYGRPLRFTFAIATDAASRRYGQALQAQWRAVGIDAQLAPMDPAALDRATTDRTFQLRLLRYGDWSDPDRLLFRAYISRGSALNSTAYTSPAVDEALIQGRATADPAVRRQAYGIVRQALARDQPTVWLHYDTDYAISRPRVRSLPGVSDASMAQVWVS
jgi:peptide/nickel transport system substrate-binding protein